MSGKCGQKCARCRCHLPEGHETPHVCSCGGSYDFRGENGKELHVYALPPGRPGVMLPDPEILRLSNQYAQSKPILIEDRPPDGPALAPFSTSRKLIRFFDPPDEAVGK